MPHPTTIDEPTVINYPINWVDDNDTDDEPPPLEAEFPSPPRPIRNVHMPMLYRTRRGNVASVNTASFDELWHSMRNVYDGNAGMPAFAIAQLIGNDQSFARRLFLDNNDAPSVAQWTQ